MPPCSAQRARNSHRIGPHRFGWGVGLLIVVCAVSAVLAETLPIPAYLTLPSQLHLKPG
jgi:hypothetical protein